VACVPLYVGRAGGRRMGQDGGEREPNSSAGTHSRHTARCCRSPLSAAPHTHPFPFSPATAVQPQRQRSAGQRRRTHFHPRHSAGSSVSSGAAGANAGLFSLGGPRLQPRPHVTALLSRPQPRAAVAASPSSAPCCRSTPAPAPLFLGGGASRWRQGSWGRSAAFSTHARLILAGFLSLSLSQTRACARAVVPSHTLPPMTGYRTPYFRTSAPFPSPAGVRPADARLRATHSSRLLTPSQPRPRASADGPVRCSMAAMVCASPSFIMDGNKVATITLFVGDSETVVRPERLLKTAFSTGEERRHERTACLLQRNS
jgi:hypothetical protein